MLLTMDIGNTQANLGVFDGDTLRFVSRIASDAKRTPDQFAVEINAIFSLYKTPVTALTGAMISSVVPGMDQAVMEAVKKLAGITPYILGPGVKSGLNITIDNPAQLGADLVAAAVAAIRLYGPPLIVLDLGTATKISAVDKSGAYLGCSISAGLGISIDAMASRTATLPPISIHAPAYVIGTNTVASMQSGLVLGTASMIDGMITRMEEEMGCGCTVAATGGHAEKVVCQMKREVILNQYLTLEGLRFIYEKNHITKK